MDRDVLDVIEREIDDEVRMRFPGGAVRHVAVLQYGDDPKIDPRGLWVRVLLNSAGPEDYERSWQAFAGAHQAAIEEFPRYLAEKVREIINVEFRFSENTDIRGGNDGPQYGFLPGGDCPAIRSGSAARPPSCTPRWARLAWKRWTR
jgi:hypothetical protein